MKLQVLQEELSRALSTCSRFSSNRIQLQVLSNILLKASKNKLITSATNLETSISIHMGAKVTEEGELTIPARTVTELISHIGSGPLDIETDKESLSIRSHGFESQIPGMNAAEFPAVPMEVGLDSISINSKDIIDSLQSTLFAVSADEIRPALTGILFIFRENSLILVSTDGFRLSQRKLKVDYKDEDRKLIIPKNALAEISRIASGDEKVTFSFRKNDNQVVFSASNSVLSSRIIDGDFPDFERIIPRKTDIKLMTDKEDLLRAVKISSVFARDAANVIKLKFTGGEVEISAESNVSGREKTKVEAKVEGSVPKDFTIAFNYRFIEDFLNVVKDESVTIEFSDPNSPCLFLDPKVADFLHIIMPIRLQS